jgi:hypothetical protein
VHAQPTRTGQWYKLSMPLALASNGLDKALGTELKSGLSGSDTIGDLLYAMGANGQWRKYDLNAEMTWRDTNLVAATDSVGAWQGFWLKRRSSGPAETNAVYSGLMQTNDMEVTFRPNAWNLIGWPYATPWREDDSGGANPGWGFAAAGAMMSNSYNNSDNLLIGTGTGTVYYFLNTDGRWYHPDNTPAPDAKLRAFEGYYYFHRGTGFVWRVKEP